MQALGMDFFRKYDLRVFYFGIIGFIYKLNLNPEAVLSLTSESVYVIFVVRNLRRMGGRSMQEISLAGKWKLYYCPEDKRAPSRPENPDDWPSIEAQVPGNVELDLFRAGIEGDPFWDENIYHFRKYEFYCNN